MALPTALPTALRIDETVTVFFNSALPSITGTFKGFRNNNQYFVVADVGDPTIEHLVQDFAYATTGPTP